MSTFNPKRLYLPVEKGRPFSANRKPPHHKPGDKFLKGPIPWKWLSTAALAQQRGKSLHVANALWFLAGIKRQDTVTLTRTVLNELGVNRYAAYRALTALEGAPLRYPIIRDPVRRILLRTFPYGLFYIADSDHTVVIACSHFRQSPRHWFRRSS